MTDRPDDSEIHVSKSGAICVTGTDAMNLFRALSLHQALKMYAKHKVLLTRAVTPSSMLNLATEYTGKKYKRGQHAQAADDMKIWYETMSVAIPRTYEDGEELS